MSDQRVKIEDRSGVRVVTHARAEKKNAFDFESSDAVWRAIEAADLDEAVRVVVVTAEGDYFSGGADVNLFLNIGSMEPAQLARVSRFYDVVRNFKKPIIAMVQGHAVGMGVTVLPHFDLVYAAEHVTFTTPFVKLGLVLEFASSHTLSRLIGVQRTKELILRAKPLDAKTAADWGLVTRVFEASRLEDEVMQIAQDLADNPPGAVASAKRLINLGVDTNVEAAIEAEDATLASCYGSKENVEAVTAFLMRKSKK